MSSKGVVRAVDKMGRVVIPKEMRKQLNVENDVDKFEIFLENDAIILKKYLPSCMFCNSFKESIKFEGYNVCVDCINKLHNLKQSELESEE